MTARRVRAADALDVHASLKVLAVVAVLSPVVGTAVVVARDRADQAALDHARTTALALDPPAGGRPSTDCDGDGLVACWHVPSPVTSTAKGLSEQLGGKALRPADTTCDRVPVGSTGAKVSGDSCFVRVRFDDRGVFVFLDPLVERDAQGRAEVVGSVVSVSAS